MNNAIHAIENDDEKFIRIEIARIPDYVVIKVINSGALIPKDIQAKIFRPFFTTKLVGKGTGLGLSISKLMAEDQGGQLELDTEASEVTFKLLLPLSKNSLNEVE